MRVLAAALLLLALPPALAGLIAVPFDSAVYVFIVFYIGLTVALLPLAGSIGTGLAISPSVVRADLRDGVVWAAWFAAALAGFAALQRLALMM